MVEANESVIITHMHFFTVFFNMALGKHEES